TINNNLVLSGNVQIGFFNTIQVAGFVFNPTGVTGGSITIVGPTTITALVNPGNFNGTGLYSFIGPITGVANAGGTASSLTIRGNETVVLSNSTGTMSTMGNVTVGDPFPSVGGGLLSVTSINAAGTGTYTINNNGTFSVGALLQNTVIFNFGSTFAPTTA